MNPSALDSTIFRLYNGCNGDEGKSKGSSNVQREPGQLKTGGARFPEHGSRAPLAICSLRRVSRVKGFKARSTGMGEQGWYRAYCAPSIRKGRFL